jgi:hypothetical protein
LPSSDASGNPLAGSSEVTRAIARVRSTSRFRDAAEKSLENDDALRTPRKMRNPRALEAASFSFSIWPSRSAVEKSSDSRTVTSAAVAPARTARSTSSEAICSNCCSAISK